MAVEFKAVGNGTELSSISYASVDLSGCAVGDLVFVLIECSNTADPTVIPNGWQLLQKQAGTYAAWLYHKVLAEGDIGTVTWNLPGGRVRAAWASYTGHDTATPIADSAKGTVADAAGTSIDFGSLTSDEAMLVVFGTSYNSTRTCAPITNYGSERMDSAGVNICFVIADTNGTWGGGTSSPTGTLSGNNYYRMGIHVAIAAAGAAPPAAGYMTTQRGIW